MRSRTKSGRADRLCRLLRSREDADLEEELLLGSPSSGDGLEKKDLLLGSGFLRLVPWTSACR